MDFLNIKNIHNNSAANFKVGLAKKTQFTVENDGSAIKITDGANTVTKLVVGGSAGFTIGLVGDKIVFGANSGSSPLCVSEPSASPAGVPGCQYLYCHGEKYCGVSLNSALENENNKPVVFSESNSCPLVAGSDLPDATTLPDGSLMMVQDGKWVSISMGELVSEITANVKSQLGI